MKAFKSLNRAGFSEKFTEEEGVEGHRKASNDLLRIVNLLEKFLKTHLLESNLETGHMGLANLFEKDKKVFSGRLETIYGGLQ